MKSIFPMSLVLLAFLTGCSDDVGTQAWCQHLNDKPKNTWSSEDAIGYAKHCVFTEQIGSDKWCYGQKEVSISDWSMNDFYHYVRFCAF